MGSKDSLSMVMPFLSWTKSDAIFVPSDCLVYPFINYDGLFDCVILGENINGVLSIKTQGFH